MKRIISFTLIALFINFISCKRIDEQVTPQQTAQLSKCPLKNVNSTTGAALASFEYTLNRIKRIVNKDGDEIGATFTYNIKNQIEKMVITNAISLQTYTVLYEYDLASGKIIKTRTSVKDYEFQVNDFVYAGDKLTTINNHFDVFGYKVNGVSKIEYIGDNVSKVLTKIEGEPELVAFEGISYDTKAQFYPDGYRTMAYGFVGLANNFFAFFGKNNATSVKIYDDNGKVDEATDITYEYNKTGIPIKSVRTVTKGSDKTVFTVAYEYMCN
jgi:hypothetical protein